MELILNSFEQLLIELIDLFCGAGGATEGAEEAENMGSKIAHVIACINHDPIAIQSHLANHKDAIHFIEDITNFDLTRLPRWAKNAIKIIWASLECTNFSNAKGGKPRDADSRTLAEHLKRYIIYSDPDYVLIENVKEFMAWGDLDKNGKPVSKDKGRLFYKWVNDIKSLGYQFEYRILNSANYGAHTSRKRLFIIFAKEGLPIAWPEATHCKDGNIYGLKKWLPVKECLDFEDKGKSIFRDPPLSPNTHERVYRGLIKYIAKGEKAFITKWLSNQKGGVNSGNSINDPCITVTTQNRIGLISPSFLLKYHGNGKNILSTEDCCSTLTTKDRLAIIHTENFMDMYYGCSTAQSVNSPAGTIMPNPKHNLVSIDQAWVMDSSFNNTGSSLSEPLGTITASRHQHYLMNPQFSSKGGSIEDPCFTLIAKMDKRPPYLITTESGEMAIEVYETDSYWIRKIKEFMALYGIIDISMRMLKVPELLKIQGFPDNYILKGNQSDQKKFIGNAVVPVMSKVIIEAIYAALLRELSVKEAA